MQRCQECPSQSKCHVLKHGLIAIWPLWVDRQMNYTYFPINLFGGQLTPKFNLPKEQRLATQFYCFYFKWHFLGILYNQHAYPYSFIRDPQRLRFWLKALAPITPLFGGISLVDSHAKYNLFTQFVAMGRGLVSFPC